MSSPSKEPRWLTAAVVRALHDESIARFGGSAGVRDEGLLESALDRPRNLHGYGSEQRLTMLAAAYGFGIARNHPFVDGNKRTALLSIAVFCALNGLRFDPRQEDEVRVITALAAGEVDEASLEEWIRANVLAE
ncbi:MAG: type II toxin-antitoxin system death-on-curing family toxin [Deinococcales bacterium]|nr:type II toxin-antitoxin system death-on-curing family toxin [Deinococcales bacterium]